MNKQSEIADSIPVYRQDLNYKKMNALYRFVCYGGIITYAAYTGLFLYIGELSYALLFLAFTISCFVYLLFKNIPYRILIPHVHVHVMIAAYTMVSKLGWEYGVQHLLLGTATLSFISPYRSTIYSYMIAFVELLLYGVLYIVFGRKTGLSVFSERITDLIFCIHAASTTMLIIFIQLKADWTGSKIYGRMDSERKKYKELTDRDTLTGLLTRYTMTGMLEAAWEQYEKDGIPFYICMADLDVFKTINDHYGHDAGDRVLIKVGDMMRSTLREEDHVARWGGDEFLLLVTQANDMSDVLQMLERLRKKAEAAEIDYEGEMVRFHMSFGCASAKGAESLRDVIIRADRALYASKNSGGNEVRALEE